MCNRVVWSKIPSKAIGIVFEQSIDRYGIRILTDTNLVVFTGENFLLALPIERLTVDQLSANSWPTVARQTVNSWLTVGRQLADRWQTVSFGNCSSLLSKLRRIWSNAVDYLLECLCIIFQPNHFPQLMNTVAKIIISQGNGKFVAYIHHVWNAKAKPLRTEFPVFWEFLGILKNSQLCKWPLQTEFPVFWEFLGIPRNS